MDKINESRDNENKRVLTTFKNSVRYRERKSRTNYVESSFDLIIKVMVDTIHSNIEPEKIKTKFKNLKPKKPENKNPVICIHNQVRGGVIEPTEDLRVDNDGTSVGTKITEEATEVNNTDVTNEAHITNKANIIHYDNTKRIHVAPKRQGKRTTNKGRDKQMNLNLLSVNCRSIKNKKSSIKEILDSQNIDIAVCSELNKNWKPPKFKGFLAFQKKSNKRFHGLAM